MLDGKQHLMFGFMVRSCTILISVLVVTPTRDNISLFLRCGIFLTDLRFFERTCTRHIAVGVLEVCASSFCKIAGRFNIELSLCEGSALRGCVLAEHTPLNWSDRRYYIFSSDR